jgi:hypothetical protein
MNKMMLLIGSVVSLLSLQANASIVTWEVESKEYHKGAGGIS